LRVSKSHVTSASPTHRAGCPIAHVTLLVHAAASGADIDSVHCKPSRAHSIVLLVVLHSCTPRGVHTERALFAHAGSPSTRHALYALHVPASAPHPTHRAMSYRGNEPYIGAVSWKNWSPSAMHALTLNAGSRSSGARCGMHVATVMQLRSSISSVGTVVTVPLSSASLVALSTASTASTALSRVDTLPAHPPIANTNHEAIHPRMASGCIRLWL
jgi:hypothetical protein